MSGGVQDEALARIAAALERLSPPPPRPADWLAHPAYVWDGRVAKAVPALDALPLAGLIGIDVQKVALRDNFARLARGAAAHDSLLWGARGMGKSALVRAAVADVAGEMPGALALVQIMPGALAEVPTLITELAGLARAFVLFCDDLGFADHARAEILALRSVLDGGVTPRPAHIRLAVTANRRAIVERRDDSEALHQRDERDDALALADRFGLTLGFHPCDRETYLAMVQAYLGPLGLEFAEEEALAFAIARGNRSGRAALQFATEVAGRAGIGI